MPTHLPALHTLADQRQPPGYGYEDNRLCCAITDAYQLAGDLVLEAHGQEFYLVKVLHEVVGRLRQHYLTRSHEQ